MSVIGVDPGIHGALATLHRNGHLDVIDMPSWRMMVGKKTRDRVDAVDLLDYFDIQRMGGAELVVIEAVGGRPKQGASAGFIFGYTVGLIYMACVAVKLPIETVPSQVWKKIMNVPGKRMATEKGKVFADMTALKEAKRDARKGVDASIIKRADELFPNHTGAWRGKNGGIKLDRAEAAILAKYGLDHALGSTKQVRITDIEWKLAYKNADTGA